ncbi:hypothetical protein LJG08_04855 [Pseudomonas aeruginosa]|uniref:hypothetical protein n=1 Tax=Pseudomonas aeruginosa TaxID=287 RepID=UPI00044A80B2|nr:hypothetical protein [Pseudomonas aeruginosa]ETV62479.1 hypothetical protein Q042_01629 [Pseudomonas aeruginosa BWHPSA037]MCC0512357.1 hypothetical protein [Pseudomonas aeruginosa]MCS7633358.1 hypothetical protein [Pseudomonas aeruginosa]
MTESKICTCPSGDGSLVHPCPAHPAVEQVGGDERAAFELFVRKHCGMPAHIAVNWDAKFTNDAWEGWKARAALAQPSQSQYEASFEEWLANELEGEDGQPVPAAVCDIALARRAFNHWPKLEQPAKVGGVRFSAGVSSRLVVEAAQRLYEFESTPEKEAERPEVAEVAFVLRNIGAMDAEDIDGDNVDLRFEDAEGRDTGCDVSIVEYAEKAADLFEQHDRIVGALRAENAQLSEDLNRLSIIRSRLNLRLDFALDKISKLESRWPHGESPEERFEHYISNTIDRAPEPLRRLGNWLSHVLDEDQWTTAERMLTGACVAAEERAAAQTQHSVPIAPQLKRALGLVVAALEADGDRPTSKYALSELKKVLAAAPGKEVPQAWIDVQAERRRQVEAEGWTPEHDDLYCAAELPRAAAAYILNGANDEAPAIWPFSAKWWKPSTARRDMVKACALALAEIERLDRAAHGKEGNDD